MKTSLTQIADDSDIVRVKMPFPETLRDALIAADLRSVNLRSVLEWCRQQLVTKKTIETTEQ